MNGARALPPETVQRAVRCALSEDLGEAGDITTDAVIAPEVSAAARIVARERLVVAGLGVAREVFRAVDASLAFEALADDGSAAAAGQSIARVAGSARSVLRGERTALNFLMRMCGIATAARAAEDEIAGSGARILDTRKTAPGLRRLDKYAVACGGALNHRMGLFDAAMIKDTHLATGVSIGDAVRRLLDRGVPADRITVEVRDPKQLELAIEAGAGRALLDNMDVAGLARAVRVADGRIALEASGGLRPGRLRAVAGTGVDFLSLGAMTHSAPAADVAMEIETG